MRSLALARDREVTTARTTQPALRLLADAAGSPAELALKLRRLLTAVAGYGDGGELDRRLARLVDRGYLAPDRVPTRLQMAVGAIDMLRFWISPAAAQYYASKGIHFGFHQVLRVLDDPASMIDPTGFFSAADVIIGHLMQVVHANPRYDLELLDAHADGLAELERQVRAMLDGSHPRGRSIGAIVEDPDYHRRLLDYVVAFRADPSTLAPVRENVVADPHWGADRAHLRRVAHDAGLLREDAENASSCAAPPAHGEDVSGRSCGAERAGFEPAVGGIPPTHGLANRVPSATRPPLQKALNEPGTAQLVTRSGARQGLAERYTRMLGSIRMTADDETTIITDITQGVPETDTEDCLVVIYAHHDAAKGRRLLLKAGPVRIGRLPDNTLVLDDDSVSRRHARIESRGQGWYLMDVGSRNGTLINGRPLDGHARLGNGDRITVGKNIIKYLSGDDAETAYLEEIYQLSLTDPLTQLANRRHFDDTLGNEVSRARRHGRPLSVALVDIESLQARQRRARPSHRRPRPARGRTADRRGAFPTRRLRATAARRSR